MAIDWDFLRRHTADFYYEAVAFRSELTKKYGGYIECITSVTDSGAYLAAATYVDLYDNVTIMTYRKEKRTRRGHMETTRLSKETISYIKQPQNLKTLTSTKKNESSAFA